MAWPRAPLHIGGWSPSKGRTLCQQFCRLGKKSQSTEWSDRGFILFKNHNGLHNQLIKCKISPHPHPLFAKWCEAVV